METLGETKSEMGPVNTSEPVPSTSGPEVFENKKNIVVLRTQIKGPFGPEQTFYLCGTSHVSKKACEDVRNLIRTVKPQVVMLELCSLRRNMLSAWEMDQMRKTSTTQHLKLWREGKEPLLTVVYSWTLSQVAERCEVSPGEEFRVALEEAQKIGAKISLGDRLVSITIARTWAALTNWEKIKFVFELLWTGIAVPAKELNAIAEAMAEDTDVLTECIKDFSASYPRVLKPLIEERDAYMVWMLRRLATQASKIVAVVGAGHLKGMQEKWDAEVDIQELCAPPTKPHKSGRSWAHVLLIATAGSAAVASVALAVHWRRRI